MSPVVAITGARGNLGAKLRAHFAGLGWTLRLTDIAAAGDPDVLAADLDARDQSWAALFEGADAVIHLAGRPSPRTSWADAVRFNIDVTQNVYEAAVRARARRVIFASSNWVMAGHRYDDTRLTNDLEPCPINPYGVSKLVGERLGRSYHERHGLEVVCFRIGYCQRDDNPPGRTMRMNAWGQHMWLSNRDLCHGMERAVLADCVGFAVLNLMSDNPGMRWDLAATRAAIGYAPADGAAPDLSDEMRAEEASGRQVFETTRNLQELAASLQW